MFDPKVMGPISIMKNIDKGILPAVFNSYT
jgi:hypothetical protein